MEMVRMKCHGRRNCSDQLQPRVGMERCPRHLSPVFTSIPLFQVPEKEKAR